MSDAPDAAEAEDAGPKKKSKGMLFGLIGAVLLGGGTFYGVFSGMVPLPFGGDESHAEEGGESMGEAHAELPDAAPVAFVPIDPLVLSLGPNARSKHLKISVSIEVQPGAEAMVQAVTPRVVDVLNTFLRAVDEREFEVPSAMMRLRAQMLRRVQLVTPQGSVRDVLIQEFVLN